MSLNCVTLSGRNQSAGVLKEDDPGQPLVSVGMSVLNCADTVGASIQSIINQSYANWELILINDGSSDSTGEVCRSFSDSRIRYLSDGNNKGLHHRLNQAIDLSRGRYFARMDGDDINFPRRFEIQAEYLMSHPDIDLIATPVLVIDDANHVRGVRGHEMDHQEICAHPWRGFPLAHPTWMGKLTWFRRFLYSDTAIRVEDLEILLRSYRTSRFAVLDGPLLAYRDIDLFSKRAARSRKSKSVVLVQMFLSSGNPMFLIYGLIYGLLSSDTLYRVLRSLAAPRTPGLPVPSKELMESWLATINNIEPAIPRYIKRER